ncbi:hypothetical protein [Acinetobacter sp. YK3]|nr:hypothetical protein [Acinetobacter sp. YK3]
MCLVVGNDKEYFQTRAMNLFRLPTFGNMGTSTHNLNDGLN